jgi:hypothetical protein
MKFLIIFLSVIYSLPSFALDRVGFTVGGASDEQQIAIDGSRFWRVGESKFFLGTGVRLTSQWSNGQTFKTAPAELTRGEEGLGAIFRQEKKSNIDELTFGQSHITSLNILFQIFYQWDDLWSVGFNIDVIGYSYGEKRTGKYSPRSEDAQWPDKVSARPSEFNLLLGDDNDLGSINSELYLLRKVSEKWAAKFGVVHAFTEYETNQRLRNHNDRFRKKNFLPTIGIVRVF